MIKLKIYFNQIKKPYGICSHTLPFLPVLLTGWAASGFGTGAFLGLAATWVGDGVLSPLTASIQNVFGTTELEGTWLSIPLEMSQADLGENKRPF